MGSRLRRSVALVGALLMFAAAGGHAVPARAQAIQVSVGTRTVSPPVASNFLGLAVEFNEIPWLAGQTPQSVNPVFTQLLRNLTPAGRPVLRIGGLSTERTWWPVPGMKRPLGIDYNLSAHWMTSARLLAQATNAELLPGIEMEANRSRISQLEAEELVKGIGSQYLDGLEIGNEPELYTTVAWFRLLHGKVLPWYSPSGTPIFNRRATYGPAQFLQEFGRTLKVMPTGIPIAGPVTGNPAWLQAFSPFITRSSPVRIVTWHAYGLNQCVTDPASPRYPSVPNLLSLAASRGFLDGISGFVNQAHRAGDAFRIDEMGPVTCNGRPGVSNTMASALWVTDALFQTVADGIDGVNLHTYPANTNALFDFATSHGQAEGIVHPLYYGVLMFAQAAPAGSRLLAVRLPSQSTLRAWATVAPNHQVRVLLLNDSLHQSAQTVVHVPGSSGSAAVERLSAPSAYASTGITLGGAGFGADTATGTLPAARPQAVTSSAGGYSVTLPAASAALLTLPVGR